MLTPLIHGLVSVSVSVSVSVVAMVDMYLE